MRVCDGACARKGMCSQRTTATSQAVGRASYALCSAFLTFVWEAGEATRGIRWSRRYVALRGMPWAGASVWPCLCWTQEAGCPPLLGPKAVVGELPQGELGQVSPGGRGCRWGQGSQSWGSPEACLQTEAPGHLEPGF